MTLCEKCIHQEVCNIRDCHEEGEEIALKYCSNFKNKADLVEVVRCKDCKHWKQVNEERRACYLLGFEMDYDEFCSYGTPKERGGEK
jgi:hypothetical protein